jgi:hypothetical protein
MCGTHWRITYKLERLKMEYIVTKVVEYIYTIEATSEYAARNKALSYTDKESEQDTVIHLNIESIDNYEESLK